MIELKTPREIEEMKPAGRFVGGILKELQETTKVGTNLLEIDEFVHKKIVDRKGAESCYVDYAPDFGTGPFAHYICTSVNDAVLHGVPYDYSLKDGDLVSLDLAISVDGWVADSAVSFVVGKDPDPEDLRIIKCTEEALAAAIDVAKPGNRLGDIGAAVQEIAEAAGYGVVREYVGHGIGRDMHEDPNVPNFGRKHTGVKLEAGMVLAIEPMVNVGTYKTRVMPDGWLVCTRDGLPSAHFEKTVAITEDGPLILTTEEGRERPV